MKEKTISISGVERTVKVEPGHAGPALIVGESRFEITVLDQTGGELLVEMNGVQQVVPFLREGDTIHFGLDGETWTAEIVSPFGKKTREKVHSMGAPMPGTILRIHVKAGDEVSKGAPLITLEAMKMEHEITSPYDGVVRSIDCSEGSMVQPGVVLISVDPLDG
ncbi:MAG: hypothetical protein KY432_07510 [Acidobacteria bacterium]|nr:hypothetical protein [Acidobacteriota bacterium]